MRKLITHQIQKYLLALVLSVISLSTSAQDYKPYPVIYPVADIPEFNYGSTTSVNYAKSFTLTWNDATGKRSNCPSVGFIKMPSTMMTAVPYGRAASLAIGYNRATYVNILTPYLNPGTYRVFLGTCFNQTTSRTCNMFNVKMDSTLLTPPADTTKRYFNTGALGTPNKQSTKSNTTGRRDYEINCGLAVILTPGRHAFSFSTTTGGSQYALTTLSLLPITPKDTITDYKYPMFDNSGHAFLSAADTTPINDTPVPVGYYLPYQAVDSTVYTTYNITLDAGLYFANKRLVVKRADDNWTRLFTGFAGADGLCSVNLPAGNYQVEVNNALHVVPINVTASGSMFVGVATGIINASFSPEPWYIGKKFQVYNSTGNVVLNEFVIPADGIIPAFALPVDTLKSYLYYVKNEDGTTFDNGTISVKNTDAVSLNLTQVKYPVSINMGSDSFGVGQDFKITRSVNANALYAVGVTDGSGAYSTDLPNGTYFLTTTTGLIQKTFTVNGSALNLNCADRYATNFCLGKTVAGAEIKVYLSSNNALLSTLIVGADGKVSCPGLPNGRYYHSVIKNGVTDTTIITKKFTFVIKNAESELGDCNNLEQPYYLPYAVYYNICNQPEITWRTSKSFKPGDLSRIKCDNYPIDTIYNIKDTTWIYTQGATKIDTTFKINYDSTSIKSITNFDWSFYYGVGGLAQPASNPFVWGDQFNFRLAPKTKLTFVTPVLNPGLYNVYLSNRWKPATQCPIIDTTYMDGKPLEIYDGIERNFKDYGNGNVIRVFQTTSGNGGLHLGEALVKTTGTHELSLYSKLGSGSSLGQASTVWSNMLYFIPVDQDSAKINSVYYPKIDYCGYFVYAAASQGNTVNHTNLGTDGVNRTKYSSQFKDRSVFASNEVDYSKKLTINGGVYSRGDNLTTVSPLDNWTTKSAMADTLTGTAIVPLKSLDKEYVWAMDVEGVNGVADMTGDKTVTIPEVINTSISSYYSITPNADDPSLGTYFLSSKITILDALPFYYPITGVIVYTLDGNMLKADGDTLYRVKNAALNGISPIYSTDMAISPSYVMGSIYTGNGSRLQSATGSVLLSSIHSNKLNAGIYPNPARETMNLRLNTNSGLASYAVYNQLGQVVRRGSFTGTQHQASLNGISKGLYLVKVKANGEELKTKLMVE